MVKSELVSAPFPGVTVLVMNFPGPPANTSTCSVAPKVALEAVTLTVKLIAEEVAVNGKFLVIILVEVA